MRMAFGAIISVVLLAIYVYLVRTGVDVVNCVSADACTKLSLNDFNDNMASTLALIAGLISALVIAELAVTKPGDVPAARVFDIGEKVSARRLMKIVTGVYLLVWLLAGLAAFFIGFLKNPGILQPLSDLGQSWLGIAVGAGYAYFGIKQEAPS